VLVGVIGFGSVWRHRPGKQMHQSGRFMQPVYYNTTGVVVNGAIHQRPRICGYARFDAVGGFDSSHPSRMIGRVFECAEPSVWMGCNKLLFRRIVNNSDRPDRFLVVAKSRLIGLLAVGTEDWRSSDTWLLSLSECPNEQEALLLMPVGGWIQSSLGLFSLEASRRRHWVARLVLCTRDDGAIECAIGKVPSR
jgi:hypothetical protein